MLSDPPAAVKAQSQTQSQQKQCTQKQNVTSVQQMWIQKGLHMCTCVMSHLGKLVIILTSCTLNMSLTAPFTCSPTRFRYDHCTVIALCG